MSYNVDTLALQIVVTRNKGTSLHRKIPSAYRNYKDRLPRNVLLKQQYIAQNRIEYAIFELARMWRQHLQRFL